MHDYTFSMTPSTGQSLRWLYFLDFLDDEDRETQSYQRCKMSSSQTSIPTGIQQFLGYLSRGHHVFISMEISCTVKRQHDPE